MHVPRGVAHACRNMLFCHEHAGYPRVDRIFPLQQFMCEKALMSLASAGWTYAINLHISNMDLPDDLSM
jgi:hypothetical protein